MATNPSITLHLKASHFRELLGDVLPFVDTSDMLPVLSCIHLRGHGDTLTARATDRYVVGIRRAAVPAPASFSANIHWRAAKTMLSAFKPQRRLDPDLSIEFSAGRVAVETDAPLDIWGLEARLSWETYDGDFPSFAGIFADNIGNSLGDAPLSLNSRHLSRFGHLGAVRAIPTGPHKPLIIRATDFLGAVMPLSAEGAKGMPVRDLGEWSDLLTPPPAQKRKTRKKVA